MNQKSNDRAWHIEFLPETIRSSYFCFLFHTSSHTYVLLYIRNEGYLQLHSKIYSKQNCRIDLRKYRYTSQSHCYIFWVLKHNARLAVFPHTLLSHLATCHTDDHTLFELTKGHGCHCESLACCFFRRVQGIVTKEGMLLKTSIISAAAGALLLLALLRLHGRASLDSCSSRASRDHKARTGHL